MEFLPYPLDCLLAGAFLSLLSLVLFLNIFGLPANWLIIGLIAIWKMAHPLGANLGLLFWVVVIAMALAGEAMEFGLQVLKARRYGSSSSGTFGGMIGAIIGAIVMAPLFWGLGALIGALIGAWAGCLLMELAKGRAVREALPAAFGTMIGRLMGTICKFGMGAAIIAFTGEHIWPEAPIGEDGLFPEPDDDQNQAIQIFQRLAPAMLIGHKAGIIQLPGLLSALWPN